jgi:hypothetical protein
MRPNFDIAYAGSQIVRQSEFDLHEVERRYGSHIFCSDVKALTDAINQNDSDGWSDIARC